MIVENSPSGKPVVHGRASSYNNYGCRCQACTKAWADYMRPRIAARRKKAKQANQTVQINF